MNDAQILRSAAKEVEGGWVRRKYEDNFGRVCALGAVRRVLFGSAIRDRYSREEAAAFERVVALLAHTMSEAYPPINENLSGYPGYLVTYVNDDMAKNGREVVALMEKAAARAEEQV